MPFYPEEIVEKVRSENDIVEVISSYLKLTKKGNSYMGLCPFHNEKTPSFSVSPSAQLYHCFGCHASGSVITFVMTYENFTFSEALQFLANRAGIELPKQELSSEQKKVFHKKERILEIYKETAIYYAHQLRLPIGKKALDYFYSRQLTDETIKRFGLGYAPNNSSYLYRFLKNKGYEDELLKESGLFHFHERSGVTSPFWNRAMFPIMDINNHVIGFGGRVMGEGNPKYLNSPENPVFEKRKNLFGLNYARTSRKPYILLCEGYMDVISLHQSGFQNAVAALGTAFTSLHATLLKRYTKEVYLTFDSDGAGISAALKAIPILKSVGLIAKVINLSPYKDPDELIKAEGAEEYGKRIQNAENSFLYEIRMLQRDYQMEDPESKTQFFKAVAKKIVILDSELERDNYIQSISDLYMVQRESLKKLVRSESAKGGLVQERVPLRSGIQKREKPDGIKLAQRLLLSWIVQCPELYSVIKPYIQVLDFTDTLYQTVAEKLFEQIENGEINPARIVNLFEDEEQQKEAGLIFNTNLQAVDSKEKMDRALKETIIKIKQHAFQYKSRHLESTDIGTLKMIIESKKKLEELQNLYFSFPKSE